MRKIFLLLLMLVVETSSAEPSMRIERYGLDQGLSQSATYTMLQDSSGFLWIGTQDGLNRFDGYQFKIFRHETQDPYSINDNDVIALLQQDDNLIWVGTNRGLCKYSVTTQRFNCLSHNKNNPQSLSTNRIHDLSKDKDGQLWVATFGGGVNIFDPKQKTFRHLRHDPADPSSLGDDRVNDLFLDSQGKMWVGTRGGGLNRFDGMEKGFTRFIPDKHNQDSISHLNITDIFEDKQGFLWVATDGGGLNRYDRVSGKFQRFLARQNVNSIGSNRVWQSYEDSRGIFWIGHEKGLDRLDRLTGTFSHHTHQSADPKSLSHNAVHVIMEDSAGLMWFGTYGGGLNKYNVAVEQFGHYKHLSWEKNSLSHNTVMGMMVDSKQRLWIGTDGGGANVLDLTTNQFSYVRHRPDDPNSLAGDQVRAVFEDRQGDMWFGIWNIGVSVYRSKSNTFEHFIYDTEKQNGLSSNRVTGFWQDDSNNIWMASFGGGLIKYQQSSNTFVHYQHDPDDRYSIGNNYITALWADEHGIFWLGTDGGLVKFDPFSGRASTLKHDPSVSGSLANDIVTAVMKDSRNNIWVGTYGGGLNLFNPLSASFSHIRQKDGLANDSVYGILEDNHGYLWISTNSGLSRYDVVNQQFVNFDANDGLQSNEFNGLAYARSKRGELFFGGVNGFNRFFGEKIRRRDNEPKVVFTDVLRFNQSVPITPDQPQKGLHLTKAIEQTDTLVLNYEDSLVTFRFAALDFANPKANQYSYKLQGFDKQWITTDASNRRATYTNLPSGEYILKVRASNSHNVWNEQGVSLKINVLAAPWLSWWAYTLYAVSSVLLVLLLVYLGVERRKVQIERKTNRQLKQMDKIKDAFLTNTAFELNAPLNGIIGLAESLIDGAAGALPDKATKSLAMVVASGRKLSNLINDILDFSKLSNDSLSLNTQPLDLYSLADVVLTTTKPLVGDKQLLLLNEVPRELPQILADEIRLQQILYNLVENAIKYTPQGHVSIRAKLDGELVEVFVSDSGIGISAEKISGLFDNYQAPVSQERGHGRSGLGLTVVKQLVTLHGSNIKVNSMVGQGSTFSFVLSVCNELAEYQQKSREQLASMDVENLEYDSAFDLADLPMLNQHNQDQNRFKLLLIDDEKVNLEVLYAHLSLANYQLVKAQSAEQALGLMHNQGPFDLVLMDIVLPKMSGFELCQKIREHWPIHDLPIILLSHRNEAQDLAQCYAVGANDCLFKPVSRHELLIRVASHLKMLDITRNLERKVLERTEELEMQKSQIERKVAQRTSDLEQSNRSLSALSEICSQISGILDWDKLLLTVYEHMKDLMETECFWIGLYQPERQRISFELAIECDELLPNTYIAMYEKTLPAVWCIDNEQPLIINDVEEEYSFYFGDVPIPEPKVGKRPLSLVYWPLKAGGRILGVISVQSFHKYAYSYAELEVIRTVASTTAIALDNARAYRKIEKQKSEVEAKVAQRTEQLELKNKEILATQQQLVQSEKMASLGTLTAGVAHEINNPTNFVHVSAQNLEVDLSRFEQFIIALAGDDADEEILRSFEQQFKPLHDHIRTIKDGTTRIKGIVKDLRAFTHLDADDKQLVFIRETLESTVNLTKTQFLELAEVVTDYKDDPQLLCYPAQLSQVFMNLIVNACDAIREHKETADETFRGKIVITLQVVDRGIEISFKDNGAGMSEVTMNKLFEPFYTTKAVGEGTGLGLSISYSIVEKHQGELKVASSLGEGTTFSLFLPTQ